MRSIAKPSGGEGNDVEQFLRFARFRQANLAKVNLAKDPAASAECTRVTIFTLGGGPCG
jgi:hypothetical protein